jgi:hypothetical protein
MARIAFTPKDAEKAAVPTEKNQLREAPGTLNKGAGTTNAPIMAKEVPMKAPAPLNGKTIAKKGLYSLTE